MLHHGDYCSECDFEYEHPENLGFTRVLESNNSPSSTQKWLSDLTSTKQKKCSTCNSNLDQNIFFDQCPNIFILEYPNTSVKTSHKIQLKTFNQTKFELKLQGIIYHGDNHFTLRILEPDGKIWYHDGMNMENVCVENGHLSAISDGGLRKCKGNNLVLAVYA